MLRQHLRKAIVDKSVPSIKLILDQAEKHDVIANRRRPCAAASLPGPKGLPLEAERADLRPRCRRSSPNSMARIINIILKVLHGDKQ